MISPGQLYLINCQQRAVLQTFTTSDRMLAHFVCQSNTRSSNALVPKPRPQIWKCHGCFKFMCKPPQCELQGSRDTSWGMPSTPHCVCPLKMIHVILHKMTLATSYKQCKAVFIVNLMKPTYGLI